MGHKEGWYSLAELGSSCSLCHWTLSAVIPPETVYALPPGGVGEAPSKIMVQLEIMGVIYFHPMQLCMVNV